MYFKLLQIQSLSSHNNSDDDEVEPDDGGQSCGRLQGLQAEGRKLGQQEAERLQEELEEAAVLASTHGLLLLAEGLEGEQEEEQQQHGADWPPRGKLLQICWSPNLYVA